MIEINLLPEEFRPPEKTNFGLIVTVGVGILISGATLMMALNTKSELATKKNEVVQLTKKEQDKANQVKEIKELESEIAQKKDRQNTIITISQSKVMWSLKLQQFSSILQGFQDFWVESLTLNQENVRNAGKKGGPTTQSILRMSCGATEDNFGDVARFRVALKDDPNFIYHFSDLKSTGVHVEELGPEFNYPERMVFSIELPLRDPTPPKAKAKPGPKPAAKPAAKK